MESILENSITWEAVKVDATLELEEPSFRDLQIPPSQTKNYIEADSQRGPNLAGKSFLEHLKRTKQNLIPELFGRSELVLMDNELQHIYGTRAIEISESQFNDSTCYLVNIITKIENSFREILERTVVAYISPSLETLNQSIHHTQHIEDDDSRHQIEFSQEFSVYEDGIGYLTEVGTMFESEKSIKLMEHNIMGFISEGSQFAPSNYF
ncbi:hypothetical protein HK096_000226, partial [Nowakowskiella sp. JEL0078]